MGFMRPNLCFQLSLYAVLLVVTATTILDRTSSPDDNDVIRRLTGAGNDPDKTIPFNSWSNTIKTFRNGLAFVIVLVAAHPLGVFFPRYFRLPLITGYLIIGIIAGPFVANVLTEDIVTMLSNYVSALALSFISFQAGQEIYLPELRPQLKSIFILLSTLYITAMVILTCVHLLVESAFFYDDLALSCQLGIALMFGSISVLGSPATVMAIKIELNSVGPFTSLMLGATMTAEFVVLLSFSIARIVSSIYCAELNVSMLNLMFTLSIVMSNVVVGVILACATYLIFQIPGGESHHHAHEPAMEGSPSQEFYYNQKTDVKASSVDMEYTPAHARHEQPSSSSFLSPQASLSIKGFIWLSMGYVFYISTATVAKVTDVMYGLTWEVKFEPLLVLMIAACITGHHTAIRHDMHVILDTAAPYFFLPFFVMTGAALKLDQVVHAIPLMTVYVLLRYIAIFIACYVGGRFLLKLTPRQYNNLWLTMTPQAGVALGLANEVKAMSEDTWAADFAATIVAAVVVNQIVGPVLCAMGLSRAGETLKDRMADENDLKVEVDKEPDYEGPNDSRMRPSRPSYRTSRYSVLDNGQTMPFYKVRNAVVIGDDEVAFEIALDLSLYGAHVNVPLLDEERTKMWQQMNATIVNRCVQGDLISYKNALQDRDNTEAMSTADVIAFTGNADRTRENIRLLKSLLGEGHPRMIVVAPDCQFSKEMRDQGILVIQPSIALANIATRMALLDQKSAQALSNEISTTNDLSTAAYFLRPSGLRESVSEMAIEARRMALGRSVVNHHSVNYDRLYEVMAAEKLPMPPPPSRVAMFGTSAADCDPFATRECDPFVARDTVITRDNGSSFFVHDDDGEEVPMSSTNAMLRSQSMPRPSGSRMSRPSFVNVTRDYH
ncbi:hypothetical protein CCR75_001983 [Bremia lactucae]|uniref:Cation/H+ exchanger transmembrane domain-containing protein n=1 Tax=Bremia lactucae TaxID=4779 RepID=A0A976IM39_BRELC|nr:hypothetical protein CCR75_001983 [Bremia lactucae]